MKMSTEELLNQLFLMTILKLSTTKFLSKATNIQVIEILKSLLEDLRIRIPPRLTTNSYFLKLLYK